MQALFRKYLNNQCTAEELSLLLSHFDKPENELLLKNLIRESLGNAQADSESTWTVTTEKVYSNIKGRIQPTKGKLIPMYKKAWVRLAAACIIVMLGVGGYLLFNKTTDKPGLAENNLLTDIEAPKTTRAMITLNNGKKVYLDSAASGELAIQSNVKLVKLENGEIAYQIVSGETVSELQYNTLSNPRGSKAVSLSLNDGTKVWLNSESSLKYPIAFADKERKVEITGEAYFEVAKNEALPFIVNVAGKQEVKVLGTHFNINSYNDEPTITTTLLEGKVRVRVSDMPNNPNFTQTLLPGQQFLQSKSGIISIDSNPDIEKVMAWKDGKFYCGESTDIASIMRQVSRWYDVDVEITGDINEHIGGTISRDVNVSKVFEKLEMTGAIQFELKGRKVIVRPGK